MATDKIVDRVSADKGGVYKYTPEQTRNMFVAKVKEIGEYWVREGKDKEDAVDGALFSTLAMIDGSNIDMPGFAVTPIHDVFEKPEHNPTADIGGSLHDAFSNDEAIAEGKELLRQALKDFMLSACAQLNLPG
jgi:hypothetical protein